MKIVITDSATLTQNNDLPIDILNDLGEVFIYGNLTGEALYEASKDADAILCNKTPIDKKLIDLAENLEYIGLFATGYNNVDTAYAKQRGITVCNAGSYSTNAVAQQTFAYILAHFSSVDKYSTLVKNGDWISSPTFSMLCCPTDELYGKTIGIIGYGSIGKKVAEIAKAFDMNVLVYTRTLKEDNTVKFVSFDELLKNSDIISAHCPLTDQNAKMFNKDAFSKMKKSALFINTARGGLVDEEALSGALSNGDIAAAALDVLTVEPMSKDCVLKDAPNITITPHTAWAPLSTRKRLLDIVFDNLLSFKNGNPKNVVNK